MGHPVYCEIVISCVFCVAVLNLVMVLELFDYLAYNVINFRELRFIEEKLLHLTKEWKQNF